MFQNDSTIVSSPSTSDTSSSVKTVSKPKTFTKPKVVKFKVDSLHIKDSLIRVDSLHKANQKKIVAITSSSGGHQGKQIPSFPTNESWVFGAILFFIVLLLLSLKKSGGNFTKAIKTLFRKKNSSNTFLGNSVNNFEYKFYFTYFIIGVVSLYVYESLFGGGRTFNVRSFALVFGINLAFYITKILQIEFVGNVFFNKRQIKSFKDDYFNLICLFAVSLFPFLILRTYNYFNWVLPFDLIAIILLLFFYILLFIKIIQIFFSKTLDTFYIFLYLCTLEILPIFILFRVYNLIV